MHYNIDFPHLGIFLEHVGKNISVKGFDIAYYGITIAVAILFCHAACLCARQTQRTGRK